MPLCPAGVKTTIKWQYPGETDQQIIGADDYSITPVHSTPTKYSWEYHMGLAIYAATAFTPTAALRCNNSPNQVRRCVDEQVISGGTNARQNYSSFYAPIYSYRVSDYVESNERCIPNGSQPLSIPCGLAKGYRKIEILCHGSGVGAYSPNPVWLTAWQGNNGATATAYGSILQVPSGGEYPVNYEPATNRYVGVIPSGYGWQYFYFAPLSSVLPTGYLFKILKGGTVVYQRSKTDKPVVTFKCGEECPPGTCECESGGVVCCYDTTTGRAVKSFAK